MKATSYRLKDDREYLTVDRIVRRSAGDEHESGDLDRLTVVLREASRHSTCTRSGETCFAMLARVGESRRVARAYCGELPDALANTRRS